MGDKEKLIDMFNLLIQIKHDNINLIVYSKNNQGLYLPVIEHTFSVKKTIVNSVIVDLNTLKSKLMTEWNLLRDKSNINKYDKIDLILPLQKLIIHEIDQVKSTQNQIVYLKQFDQSQFRVLTTYDIQMDNQLRLFSCFINKKILDDYLDLFKSIGINLNNIYSVSWLLGMMFADSSEHQVLVELGLKQISYYFYYQQKIIATKSINMGVEYLVDQLFLELKNNYQIKQIVNKDQFILLLNTQCVQLQKDPILILSLNHDPVSYHYLSWSDLAKRWKNIIDTILVKNINQYTKDLKISDLKEVIVSGNEYFVDLLNINNPNPVYNYNKLSSKTKLDKWMNHVDPVIQSYFANINKVKDLSQTVNNAFSVNDYR